MTIDPYYLWLGISPDHQPPNYYQLLGLRDCEPNADVIESAADRQMTHLKSFQNGPHGALSQKLLNEVSEARICLLSPQKKSRYDAGIRDAAESANSIGPPAPAPVAPTTPTVSPPPESMPENAVPGSVEVGPVPTAKRRKESKRTFAEVAKVVGGGIVGLLAAVLVLKFAFGVDPFGVFGKNKPNEKQVAKQKGADNSAADGSSKTKTTRRPQKVEPKKKPRLNKVAPADKRNPGGRRKNVSKETAKTRKSDKKKTDKNELNPPSTGPAIWIWTSGPTVDGLPQGGVLAAFRRSFVLPSTPSKAVVAITADDQFSLYINGRLVAGNQSGQSVETLAVTKFLVAGRNEIHVFAANAGLSPSKAGIYVDLRADSGNGFTTLATTDEHWRWVELESSSLPASPSLMRLPPASEWQTAKQVSSSWPKTEPQLSAFDANVRQGAGAILLRGAKVGNGNAKLPVKSDTRPAVPDSEALTKAMGEVKQLFGEQYSRARTAADKARVAQEMLAALPATKDNPAERFALLSATRDMAAEAFDAKTAFAAIEHLEQSFSIDSEQMYLATVTRWATRSMPTRTRDELLVSIKPLVEKASQQKRFALLISFLESARSISRGATDRQAAKQLTQQITATKALVAKQAVLQSILDKLKSDPADPAANLAAGRHYCFQQEDWKLGLPLLAKSGSRQIKRAAVAELAVPISAEAADQVADQWRLAADELEGADRLAALRRAMHWYEVALPGLSGRTKAATEKAVVELELAISTAGKKIPPSRRRRSGLMVYQFKGQNPQPVNGAFLKSIEGKRPLQTRVTPGISKLFYKRGTNAVAFGFLYIKTPGVYHIKTYNYYDRNSLFLNGRLVCPHRDSTSRGSDKGNKGQRVVLPKGMIPIVIVGYHDARGTVNVTWRPPGQEALSKVPNEILFHDPFGKF